MSCVPIKKSSDGINIESSTRSSAYIEKSTRLWKNGSAIEIEFTNGTKLEKELVKKYAAEWSRYANIDFKFFEKDEIRKPDVEVVFGSFENSSFLGRVRRRGRVRFDEFPKDYKLIRGIVLHEFGHLLGLSHGHQRWDADFNLSDVNKNAFCEIYFENSETRCKNNFVERVKEKDVKRKNGEYLATDYDVNSIMHYHLPDMFKGISLNWETPEYLNLDRLSYFDKYFIAQVYPGKVSLEDVAEMHEEDERKEAQFKNQNHQTGLCRLDYQGSGSSCKFKLSRIDGIELDDRRFNCTQDAFLFQALYFIDQNEQCHKKPEEVTAIFENQKEEVEVITSDQCQLKLPGEANAFGNVCGFGVQIVDAEGRPTLEPELHGCFYDLDSLKEKISSSELCALSNENYSERYEQYYSENYQFNHCRILQTKEPSGLFPGCHFGYAIVGDDGRIPRGLNFCFGTFEYTRNQMIESDFCQAREVKSDSSNSDEFIKEKCIVSLDNNRCSVIEPYRIVTISGKDLPGNSCYKSFANALNSISLNHYCLR